MISKKKTAGRRPRGYHVTATSFKLRTALWRRAKARARESGVPLVRIVENALKRELAS